MQTARIPPNDPNLSYPSVVPKEIASSILDVARYKYPPVWVGAADLFDAMNTRDADNQNRTRGFVLIVRATRQ